MRPVYRTFENRLQSRFDFVIFLGRLVGVLTIRQNWRPSTVTNLTTVEIIALFFPLELRQLANERKNHDEHRDVKFHLT